MKPLLPFVTLLLVGLASSNLYAQWPPLGKEELRKNKIKGIREYGNSVCDPDAKKSDPSKFTAWSNEVSGYDSRGNKTDWHLSSTWTVPQGWFKTWKYDDQDNVIETEEDYVKSRFEHRYTLNDKGKVIEDTYPGGKRTFKYDAAGRVAESAYFKQDGGLFEKTTHTYEKGEVAETRAYDAGGHLSSRTVETYDEAGHDAKYERYDSAAHLSSRVVYTYDGAGHRTGEEKYESDGHLTSRTLYTYDQAGQNAKQEDYGPDGKPLDGWSTFKFDAKGLVTESNDFNSKGDCKWIKKIWYEFYP
jgi:YD repeat-containing protein